MRISSNWPWFVRIQLISTVYLKANRRTIKEKANRQNRKRERVDEFELATGLSCECCVMFNDDDHQHHFLVSSFVCLRIDVNARSVS